MCELASPFCSSQTSQQSCVPAKLLKHNATQNWRRIVKARPRKQFCRSQPGCEEKSIQKKRKRGREGAEVACLCAKACLLRALPATSLLPLMDSPTGHLSSKLQRGPGLQHALRGHLAGDLVRTFQKGVVDILGTRDLGFDHGEVLGVGQTLRLDRIGLGGSGHERRGVLGAVETLGEALVGQALGKAKSSRMQNR